MKVTRNVLGAFIFLLSFKVGALDWQESPQVGQLFRSAGVTGAFVLYDVTQNQLMGHNRERAYTQFVPASTFKIANTLVGLSVGAAKSIDETLPYGGKPQPVKAWERDMSLREAIAMSNVPIYQELARRIGLERMRHSLVTMRYGNGEVGTVVDRFWLDGPLKISAVEQIEFLARLAQGVLPIPQTQQEAVRESVRLDQQDHWTLYGKTGWQGYPNPGVGWWVGWVMKNGHIYIFALNMDMREAADAAKRLDLGRASLEALGVI